MAAPSLIPQKPGERIKTDRRDARKLTLALQAGTLSMGHLPTPEQKQFRDVVRAWQQVKRDVPSARPRLKALLLRHEIPYTARANGSAAHRRWLAEWVLPSTAQQIVFQELIDAISERERRRDRLERQLDTCPRVGPATH